ncbi:hypothetical protein HNR60_003621 [Rhodopseudomonas rhenobacensis]|uniref:Cytochrome c n=1 Tax=Rhodopseudomonas rhenobacensis TaxID=87461 RepID=A0A7W7Z6D3_9BRAD|nr:hypothetical protein [Rhodopseudomonas rhenobacensis]MBB5048851.1 hypothetical protein [Rhodopseudomonas rhenobacensis]
MTSRCFVFAMLAALASGSLAATAAGAPAMAQQPNYARTDNNPRLADIMEAARVRHLKLWFAGKAGNWDLAAYEANQIKARLEDAASLYQSLPLSDVTAMAAPIDALAAAIAAKSPAKFTAAFDHLTAGCNACHQNNERSFIAIRQPTSQPFSNQVFEGKR